MTQPDQPPQQPQWGPPSAQWGPPPGYPPQQQWGPPAAQPHAPPPPPPREPRFGLGARIGLVVLGLFVVGSLGRGSDSGSDSDTRSSTTPVPLATAPRQAAQPAAPPVFPGAQPEDLATTPGGTLTAGDITVTATELRDGSSTFGSTLCTTVTYVNNGDDLARFGPFDWSLQNPSGVVLTVTFFGGADSQLNTGELAPGGTVTGDLCFEDENASAGDYLVLYEAPGLFTDQRLAWVDPR